MLFLELTDTDDNKFMINSGHIATISAGEESGCVIECDDGTEVDVKETYSQVNRMINPAIAPLTKD